MKSISHLAVAAAIAVGGAAFAMTAAAVPAHAQEEAEPFQPDLSKAARKPIVAASEAITAQDWAAAEAALAEADAAAENPDDAFLIGQMRVQMGQARSDNAMTEQGIKQMLDSGSSGMSPDRRVTFLNAMGSFANQRQDTAAALGYFKEVSDLQPNDPTSKYNLAVLQLQNDQAPEAYKTFGEAIQLAEANGQTAEEAWYRQRFVSAVQNQYDLMDPAVALVAAYPTPKNWRDVLLTYRDQSKLSDDRNLDVFRLLADADALESEGDYFEYADTAYRRRYLGEARTVLEEGTSAGALDSSKSYVGELNKLVDDNYAADQAELDSLASEAASEADGTLAESTATAYLGYGNNQEAVRLYRLALEKGGVDTALVNTRLGIALVRMGDREGARAAFEAASQGEGQDLAAFWLAYLDGSA